MLEEPELYIRIKKWLDAKGWKVVGGQPPGGTNIIPLIELHDPEFKAKGSIGSKKIDVVSYRESYFLLVELKPLRSLSDIKKLNTIVAESKWRLAFVRTLKERNIWKALAPVDENRYLTEPTYYIKGVGFNDTGRIGPRDFVTFLFTGEGIKVKLGPNLPEAVRYLFI